MLSPFQRQGFLRLPQGEWMGVLMVIPLRKNILWPLPPSLYILRRPHPRTQKLAAMYDQYTWVFALSVIVAFFAAFGIGM